MSFGKHTGASVSKGESIIHSDYDVLLDSSPEELVEEFREEVNYRPEEADIETLAEDVQAYVVDNIEHVNAVAEEMGWSYEAVDESRVSQQSENGAVLMSNVWDGIWRDRVIGTCQERALTGHAMYREFGVNSEYHSGALKTHAGEMAQHAWTTVEGEYISDPSANGDGFIPIEDADRYIEQYFWTK